ncbi:MAG: hypothetical protein KF861_21735, partial [Planctomycetaceae bacterium]|nr:hypothetical protein [Planctomycetaceae bacterium]
MTISTNKRIAASTGLVFLCLAGCSDSGGSGHVGTNPYDNAPAPLPAAAPGPVAPAIRSTPRDNGRPAAAVAEPRTDPRATEPPSTPEVRIPPVRDAGGTAASLSLPEYSRMARLTAEVLTEISEIHAAVDESLDSAKYQ